MQENIVNNKILTVAVCAYNMEKLLGEALDSCIVSGMEKMEVLIMNDGSKDRTAEIGRSYMEKYPETFKLVDKINGGWGSNINMAVGMAKGKYFKILDADDWFDKENLSLFLGVLENNDADAFVSNHVWSPPDARYVNKPDWMEFAGTLRRLSELPHSIYYPIWDICFRTDLVRKYHRDLPEKTLYTDNIFIAQLIPHIDTAYFFGEAVYFYRIGRDGQSVSTASIIKHYQELLKVFRICMSILDEGDNVRNIHLISKVSRTYSTGLRDLRKAYGSELDVKKIIREQEAFVKAKYPSVYKKTNELWDFRLLRFTEYALLPVLH